MTARNDVRRGRVDARGDVHADRGFAADGPTLPERLVEAREQKGVDIYRAERDTKIRVRYLRRSRRASTASCRGPCTPRASCATTRCTSAWTPTTSSASGATRTATRTSRTRPCSTCRARSRRRARASRSRPSSSSRRCSRSSSPCSPFYLGIQLVRFAKPPTLAVTSPGHRGRRGGRGHDRVHARGHVDPQGDGHDPEAAREQPYRVSADATGRWTADVQLRRGRNEFTISAIDPETVKTVGEHREGVHHGAVPRGRGADARRSTRPRRARSSRTGRSRSRVDDQRLDGRGVRRVYRARRGRAGTAPSRRRAARAPKVGPQTVKVDADGTFEHAARPLDRQVADHRHRDVARGQVDDADPRHLDPYKGVKLVVEIKNGRAWLKVWVDGKVSKVTGAAGKVFSPGKVADVHRQAGDRGPHRQVERDVLHAQRQGPRPDVEQGQPRDVAVRAARRPGPHRAAT